MKPKTLREDNTTKINHKSIKYADVSQAHILGPPSSAPIVRRLNTRTAIQPAEVTKKTRREKLSPAAFSTRNGSPYAMKLYVVSISQGTPIPT